MGNAVEQDLSARLLRVALSGSIHADDPNVIADAQAKIDGAKKAADAILAPMTIETGRLLEEVPDHIIVVIAFGEEILLTAKHFMDLYEATE